MKHEKIEKNVNLMAVLIVVVISIGGLIEIIPLMASASVTEPYEGVTPYPAVELAGRDVYVREGCYVCHSQQIRPFRSETKRTGPDLARVGGRYSDEWHRLHLIKPQDLVPDSNMPAYPWLANATVDGELLQRKMRALQLLGDPYTDAEIEAAAAAVDGVSELEALIAYLQNLGTVRSAR